MYINYFEDKKRRQLAFVVSIIRTIYAQLLNFKQNYTSL